jgi:hypothetical protein
MMCIRAGPCARIRGSIVVRRAGSSLGNQKVAQPVRQLTPAILSQLVRELAGSILPKSVAEFDGQRPEGIETEKTNLCFVRNTQYYI